MKKPDAGLLRPLFPHEVFAMLALSTELLEDLANQVLTDYFGTDHFPIHPVEIELFASTFACHSFQSRGFSRHLGLQKSCVSSFVMYSGFSIAMI